MFKEQALPRPDTAPPIKKPPIPTGAAFSVRFETTPPATNEDIYDRREAKRAKREKREAQEIQRKGTAPNKTLSKYTLLALSPEGGLKQAIALWKKDNVKKWLLKSGVLKEHDGMIILADKKKLSREGWSQWIEDGDHHPAWDLPEKITSGSQFTNQKKSIRLENIDFFAFLKDLPAAEEDGDKTIKPITTLPASFDQVISDEYPACHLKPWEVFSTRKDMWDKPLTLTDGTETCLAELHIASRLHELNASPIGKGKFSITDPKTGERISLSTHTFIRKYLPPYGDTRKASLQGNPGDFAQQHLKNLARANILQPTSFKKMVSGFESSNIAPSD